MLRGLETDRATWTLPHLLRERARELGGAPLVSCALGDGRLSYVEADDRSDRLAAGLAALGVGHGDRAMLMLGNRVECVLAWFALNKLGACHAPINLDYRGEFLEHLTNVAGATVLVLEARYVPVAVASQDRIPGLEHLVVVGDVPADTGRFAVHAFEDVLLDAAPPAVDVRPSDPFAVMFTSGSTGRSKGALLPQGHARLLNAQNAELLGLDGGSVYTTDLPLFHINAHMTVYSSMLRGGQARLEERFSASRWLERLRASGGTHTSLLGVMVDFLLKQPPREDDADNPLRSAWMVPCSPALADGFRDRFGVDRIATSYGNSETGMLARRVVGRDDAVFSGELSRDLYDVEVVGPDDEPLPDGETGEIVVRPKLRWTTSLGYLGMPDRTAESLVNLWLHTGDLGRIEGSRLTFLDRAADRIRRRGENVASADVEHALGGHPSVAEVAVVAVAADDGGGEDEIKACVVCRPGAAFDAPALWAWADARLPAFAVPRYLQRLDALPKTPTAKVMKVPLRETTAGELVDRLA